MASLSVAHVAERSEWSVARERSERWEWSDRWEQCGSSPGLTTTPDLYGSVAPRHPDGSVGPTGIEPLYRKVAYRLEQIVRADVTAPPAVIEDACAAAWTRLVLHATRVRRDAAFGWLVATAEHEAWRLVRREGRELSLETIVDQLGDNELHPLVAGADEVFEQHQRIRLVAGLPRRQRRILGLHALGLSYVEMAEVSGYTKRTVERELIRARRGVRALAAA